MTKEGYLTQIDNGGFRLPVLSGLSDADGNALDTAAQAPLHQQSFGGPASADTTGGSGFGGPQQPPNPHAAHYSAPPPPDTFTTGRNQQPPPQDYGGCCGIERGKEAMCGGDGAEETASGEGRNLWVLSCRLGAPRSVAVLSARRRCWITRVCTTDTCDIAITGCSHVMRKSTRML